MRALLVALFVSSLALSGCIADEPDVATTSDEDEPAADMAPGGPLMVRHSCFGYNAIFFADGASMRPHVPANWTFTSPSGYEQVSILRINVVGCGDTGLHAIVSTPMQPDAASAHHHDNPDVVIGIYADDADVVANFSAHGVPAWNASIDWSEGPRGDDVIVATDDGIVFTLASIDARHPARDPYTWPATYAAGTDHISWFWGHENITTRRATAEPITMGRASPVPDLVGAPWYVAAWLGYDVTYAVGTPTHHA